MIEKVYAKDRKHLETIVHNYVNALGYTVKSDDGNTVELRRRRGSIMIDFLTVEIKH